MYFTRLSGSVIEKERHSVLPIKYFIAAVIWVALSGKAVSLVPQ